MIKLFGSSQILRKDETLTIVRTGTTYYVDGKPVKYNETTFQIVANVQPLNGKQLEMVPEHDRGREQYWIFVLNGQTILDRGLQVKVQPPLILLNDRIIRADTNFQVQETENWGTYFKARMMSIDVGRNSNPP